MTAWTDYCGIFENKGSWKDTPGNIDYGNFTALGDDYIILKITKVEEVEDPQVNIKLMPSRKHLSTGVGKNSTTLSLEGYVVGDSSHTAIYYYNLVKSFCRGHDKMSNNAAYLVIREQNQSSTWEYEEFEDDDGDTQDYLKGKISGLRKRHATHNKIEYTLQFSEAWLP